jgi:hypothetical protein
MDTRNDTPFVTFLEETVGALDGKEGYLLMLGTNENTVKLATSGDVAIGVMAGKLQNGSIGDGAVNVRLLGKGGTVKVKAGGIIAKGARVIWGTGGVVLTQTLTTGSYRTLGRKLGQGSSALNDVIEILDLVEPIIVP